MIQIDTILYLCVKLRYSLIGIRYREDIQVYEN